MAVVCGTSAGTAARSPAGRLWHSSYWQEPEGAEDLARQALRAVYRAELGIPADQLDGAAAVTLRVPQRGGAAAFLTARDRPAPAHLGRLARLLLDEAAAGDPVSGQLVQRHGEALGDYALAAARQVGLEGRYLLVTSGGVMRHPSPLLRRSLLARVQVHPQVTWQASRHEPVFGALLLALELAGQTIGPAQFHRLEETCPDEALFLT